MANPGGLMDERTMEQDAAAMVGRRQADKQWRAHVDTDLSTGNDRMAGLEKRMSGMELRMGGLETGLATNTQLTADRAERIERKLDEHRDRTAPVVEMVEGMRAGVEALGKIATATGRVASWWGRALRLWAPVVAALTSVVATCVAVWLAFHDQLVPYVDAIRDWWHR